MGNSYNEDFFNTPDLSYAGRTLKYHFITTRIPGFFSEISGLSIFESVFFLTPLFNVAVLFLILKSFFTEFKEFRTPTWFLFSMPLIFINLRLFSGILGKTVLLTNSYFLAFIFSIFIIYFFLKDRRLLLYIGLVILIIVRAPVFITLLGGILL